MRCQENLEHLIILWVLFLKNKKVLIVVKMHHYAEYRMKEYSNIRFISDKSQKPIFILTGRWSEKPP